MVRVRSILHEIISSLLYLFWFFVLMLMVWRFGVSGIGLFIGMNVIVFLVFVMFLRIKRKGMSRERKGRVDVGLRDWLKGRVIGQDKAIDEVVDTILVNTRKQEVRGIPKRVLGVFMFVGMTGVGKTETAKAVGEWFRLKFGHQFLRFDMGNFSDRYMASTLTGSPRGYIGSEEGGALTRPLMRNPKAVILFDEIEKGDRSLYKVFMSLIDEGIIQETSTGNFARVHQSVIVFTTNLMQGTINELQKKVKDRIEREILIRDVLTGRVEGALKYVNRDIVEIDLRQRAGEFLPPEFLGRIDKIVVFRELSEDDLFKILLSVVERTERKISNVRLFEIFEKTKPIAKTYGVRQFIKKVEEELYK